MSEEVEEWRSLYTDTFGYRRPLCHPEHGVFLFQQIPKNPGREDLNPWKTSYEQLSRGIHVMNNLEQFIGAAEFQCFDHIEEALRFLEENPMDYEKLIFLHEGTHEITTTINITSDVQILGASGSEDIASTVILTGKHSTVLEFSEGSKNSYLGHITVKYEFDEGYAQEEAENLMMEVEDDEDAVVLDPVPPRPPNGSCAMIVTGREAEPTVEHCHFQSTHMDCHTVVVKDHAAPKIRNSTFIGGSGGGILITDEATGYYNNCEIARNPHNGIRVMHRANPYFYDCHIHHHGDVGIFVIEDGLGHFQNCNIYENLRFGIELKSPLANPTVTECEIHHGKAGGVRVHEGATGQFLKNRIYQNEFAAFWVERADPIVRQNELFDGKHGGVIISEYGKGLIEENEVYGNELAGLIVLTGADPKIRNNHIHSGKQAGIHVYEGGCGTIEANEINGNGLSGVQITTGANPRVIKNRIWNNDNGVLIQDMGMGFLEENTIFDNSFSNVFIKSNAMPVVRKNKIFGAKGTGVSVVEGGKGVIEENEIFDNAQAGVLVLSDGCPMIRGNRVHGNRSGGIEISSKGPSTIRENRVFRNRFGGIMTASGSNAAEDSNQVYDNLDRVKKTIERGQCLYSVSGKEWFPIHNFYRCITCNTSDCHGICQSCIQRCHVNHVVTLVRCDRFYCDCGADNLDRSCCLVQP